MFDKLISNERVKNNKIYVKNIFSSNNCSKKFEFLSYSLFPFSILVRMEKIKKKKKNEGGET